MNGLRRLTRTTIAAACLALFALGLTPHAQTPARKPMSLIDLASLQRIAIGAQLSPDGRSVAYALSFTDWKLGRLVYHLWRQDVSGGAPEQLTFSEAGDAMVLRWSPDGKTILFAREGQLWLLAVDGGEPRALTKHATLPTNPSWSPDGTTVYFIATDPPTAEDRERTRLRDDVIAFDDTFKQRHLWKIVVSTGAETQITTGDFSVKDYSLSKDGKRIALQRAPAPADMDAYRGETWIMDASGENARVLTSNAIEERLIALSPDGTQVLFVADTNDRFEPNYPTNLFIVSTTGGAPRLAVPDFKYSFDQAVWAPDGKSIIANVNMGVHTEFFRIDVAARQARQLTDGAHLIVPGWSAVFSADKIVYQADEPTRFGEVWTLPLTGAQPTPTRVTRQFDTLERDFAIPRQEKAEWKGADGVAIEGVLLYPANYQQGQRYPLVVQLHGGPMDSDKFGIGPTSTLFYLPVLTGKGYFVLRPNYRGSSGYGPAFVRDVVDGYFHQMAPDVLLGVDSLIARGLVDKDRLVLTGWSAGGTLVDKIVTMTDRFKVASSGAGITNWVSLYGQTDSTSFRRTWFGGSPWRKDAPFDLFWSNSPIRDVSNVKTPMLFFAGQDDTRVPKEQSIEMFRALRTLNVPTQLLIAPNEGHFWQALPHVLRKANIELEWFEKYVNGRAYVWEKVPTS